MTLNFVLKRIMICSRNTHEAGSAALFVSVLGFIGLSYLATSQHRVTSLLSDVGYLGKLGSLPRFSVSTSAIPPARRGARGRDAAQGLARAHQQIMHDGALGGFQVVQPTAGVNVGEVAVSELPSPPPPPPTVVRYGDVGVTPKGCPTCPVLDTKVVSLQMQQMKDNQARIDRLARLIQKNHEVSFARGATYKTSAPCS
jgi:hypothetical protein